MQVWACIKEDKHRTSSFLSSASSPYMSPTPPRDSHLFLGPGAPVPFHTGPFRPLPLPTLLTMTPYSSCTAKTPPCYFRLSYLGTTPFLGSGGTLTLFFVVICCNYICLYDYWTVSVSYMRAGLSLIPHQCTLHSHSVLHT